MLKRTCLLTPAIGILLAAAACGGSNGNPANPGTTTNKSTMSATIDGTPWNATATVLAIRTPATVVPPSGTVGVTGTNAFTNYTEVTFAVPAAVGTYQIGPLTIGNAAVDLHPTPTADLKWTSKDAGGSGTITLSTLTSTGASGTFSFNLMPSGAPATGTKVVTSGVFNVTF